MEGMTLVSFEGKSLSCMLDGDDLPWFSGKEAAIALGYKRPHNAIGRYVMHDEKKKVMKGHTPQNRDYGQTYINEPGLYRLIFSINYHQLRGLKHRYLLRSYQISERQLYWVGRYFSVRPIYAIMLLGLLSCTTVM